MNQKGTKVKTNAYFQIRFWLAAFILLLSLGSSYADEPKVTIKKTDRCPVCGMFVYKYPKWVAQILFKDGSYYFYDGAKDMFKHISDTAKYTPGQAKENIKAIFVTDYYEVELIDANSLIDWIKTENNLQLIDVRTPNEFANRQWPLSKNIPLADLQFRLSEIDSLLPVVIICQTGVRSSQAAILLKKENSLQKVFSLQGGLSSLL